MTYEVGVLSVRGHPLLPTILSESQRYDHLRPVVIADRRGLRPADIARFHERTGDAFVAESIDPSVEVIDVPDHNGPELRRILRDRGIRVLANAGTPRRLALPLLKAADGGIVNAHPGILPAYRGASAPEWAIYNDDPVGVTAHFIDEGIDSGPVIAIEILRVQRDWDYTALRVAVHRLQARVLAASVARVVREGIAPADLPPQPRALVRRPIPDDLLEVVKTRLARGRYAHAR